MTTRLLPIPGVQVLSGLFVQLSKKHLFVQLGHSHETQYTEVQRSSALPQSFLFLGPATAASPMNSSCTHQSTETDT